MEVRLFWSRLAGAGAFLVHRAGRDLLGGVLAAAALLEALLDVLVLALTLLAPGLLRHRLLLSHEVCLATYPRPALRACVSPTRASRRLRSVVAGPDFETQIKQLQATMHTIEQVLDLDAMRARDRRPRRAGGRARPVGRPGQRPAGDRPALRCCRASSTGSPTCRAGSTTSSILLELAQEESDADSMAEAEAELRRIHKAVEALEVRTLLSGEYDAREALVTIRSGAGGVDAADFAEMLMRMYTRWAERNKYPVEVFDTSYAEEAGLKSATFAIHAPYAYGTLSVEAGTHRLVRISPFDNQGRRQTSFAAVEVVPVLEQTDEIDIPDEEIRVDVYRSSGPGRPVGQHHRLRGPADPHPDRHGRLLPEREVPAAEQGQRDGHPQGQAARAEEGRGAGPARRAARRRAGLVGRPDAQLRAAPLPDGQGPAHRVRVRQPAGRASTARSTPFLEAGIRWRRGADKAAAASRSRLTAELSRLLWPWAT